MPTPLRDPKYSSRWYGAGALGRFREGQQSQQPVQMPSEYNPEYSYFDNPPLPAHADVQAQADQGAPFTGNYLDGWDYRSPPVDGEGNPLGPQGNILPQRAMGWDPYGNPYYGEGVAAYMKGVADRLWSAPIEKPDRILPEQMWVDGQGSILGSIFNALGYEDVPTLGVGDVLQTIPRAWRALTTLGQGEGEKVGFVAFGGRMVE